MVLQSLDTHDNRRNPEETCCQLFRPLNHKAKTPNPSGKERVLRGLGLMVSVFRILGLGV